MPYANVVGSIMYFMVCCRPDLSYFMSVVGRFMANPGKRHWEDAKWVLRYISGTIDVGLKYANRGEVPSIEGYVDFDFAKSIDTRKSTTGYAFKVFGNLVNWRANLQSVVALSTTEVEYIATNETVKESLWLRDLVSELLQVKELKTTVIHCDSQSAVSLSKNQVYHDRRKHVDIKYHFIRDIIKSEVVAIKNISTNENVVDMLTKALPSKKFNYYLQLLNNTGSN